MSDTKTKEKPSQTTKAQKSTQRTNEQPTTNNQNTTNTTQKRMKKFGSKKFWIIATSILCAIVLIVTITASIVIVTRKKLDITPTNYITYNEHKNLRVVSPANNVSVYNSSNPTYYSNCTVLVMNEDTDAYGVYSYAENKQVIPTNYAIGNITAITLNNQGNDINENIFQLGKKIGEISNEISFYNDEGKNIEITHYDSDKAENYTYIKQRKLSVSEKRKGVKVSTKNKFEDEKIYIKDISYSTSYIVEGKYNYEVWNITAKDGTAYKNLYKVEDKQRTLIQTLNNLNGNSVELSDSSLQIGFLKNNEPCFYTKQNIASVSGGTLQKYNVFDKKLNNIGSAEISTQNLEASFQVGNKLIFQFIKSANEEEYDFAIDYSYFKVSTYSLNLKNGKYKEEKFDYIISNYNTSFNSETALITAQKIENKSLSDSKLLLMNDYLKTKAIDYKIDTITQISEDRYLVENSQGQYLIDDKYNLICYLGNYDDYFTTGNAIMLSKTATGYTFVTSLDGIVIKKYRTNEITNVHNEKYYMIETTTKKEDGVYTEKYLETLGVRQSNPIYSQKEDSSTYIYKGVEYVGYNDQIIADGVSIITRIRLDNNTYTYEFYNIDGEKLLQLENFATANRVLNYWHYIDDNNILLYISTNVGGIGYTLIVDR